MIEVSPSKEMKRRSLGEFFSSAFVRHLPGQIFDQNSSTQLKNTWTTFKKTFNKRLVDGEASTTQKHSKVSVIEPSIRSLQSSNKSHHQISIFHP
jgi:hypothetical protein